MSTESSVYLGCNNKRSQVTPVRTFRSRVTRNTQDLPRRRYQEGGRALIVDHTHRRTSL
jgi:hypothetical protein